MATTDELWTAIRALDWPKARPHFAAETGDPEAIAVSVGTVGEVEVFVVDGHDVQANVDNDFADGMNDLVAAIRGGYPVGEGKWAWVNARLEPSQWPFVALHELVERDLMETHGMTYPEAHAAASEVEANARKATEVFGEKRARLLAGLRRYGSPNIKDRIREMWLAGMSVAEIEAALGFKLSFPSGSSIGSLHRDLLTGNFDMMSYHELPRFGVAERRRYASRDLGEWTRQLAAYPEWDVRGMQELLAEVVRADPAHASENVLDLVEHAMDPRQRAVAERTKWPGWARAGSTTVGFMLGEYDNPALKVLPVRNTEPGRIVRLDPANAEENVCDVAAGANDFERLGDTRDELPILLKQAWYGERRNYRFDALNVQVADELRRRGRVVQIGTGREDDVGTEQQDFLVVDGRLIGHDLLEKLRNRTLTLDGFVGQIEFTLGVGYREPGRAVAFVGELRAAGHGAAAKRLARALRGEPGAVEAFRYHADRLPYRLREAAKKLRYGGDSAGPKPRYREPGPRRYGTPEEDARRLFEALRFVANEAALEDFADGYGSLDGFRSAAENQAGVAATPEAWARMLSLVKAEYESD